MAHQTHQQHRVSCAGPPGCLPLLSPPRLPAGGASHGHDWCECSVEGNEQDAGLCEWRRLGCKGARMPWGCKCVEVGCASSSRLLLVLTLLPTLPNQTQEVIKALNRFVKAGGMNKVSSSSAGPALAGAQRHKHLAAAAAPATHLLAGGLVATFNTLAAALAHALPTPAVLLWHLEPRASGSPRLLSASGSTRAPACCVWTCAARPWRMHCRKPLVHICLIVSPGPCTASGSCSPARRRRLQPPPQRPSRAAPPAA